jgi:hypothetical protein
MILLHPSSSSIHRQHLPMAPWKQSSVSAFSRPIGVNESFIKLVGDAGLAIGKEHWAIRSTARIILKGELTEFESLRTRLYYAWGHLRFKHPSVAAYVANDQKTLLYDIPSRAELDAWMEETFRIMEDVASVSELVRTLKPSPFARLFYLRESGEILGYTSHWRNDGLGVVILLDSLLRLLVSPDLSDPGDLPWGEEVARLSPCVEDAVGSAENPNEDQQAIAKACVDTFGLIGGSTEIPYNELAPTPQGTMEELVTLDPDLTLSIMEAARSKGVNVKAAVHASVAAANWDCATGTSKTRHYTSTIRVSLRSHLNGMVSPDYYASGLYTTGWMDKVEATDGWLTIAKHYHNVYQQGISPAYIQAHRAYAAGLVDAVRNAPQDLPPPSNVDFSVIDGAENLLASSYGSDDLVVEVEGMTVGLDLLSPQAFCFMWVFRERLNVSVVYNQAYHAKQQMKEFLRHVENNLLEGLQVQR